MTSVATVSLESSCVSFNKQQQAASSSLVIKQIWTSQCVEIVKNMRLHNDSNNCRKITV